MSQRERNLIWLRDVLENLRSCQQQLEWAEDPRTVDLVTETMLRDLECCRRLCDGLHQRAGLSLTT